MTTTLPGTFLAHQERFAVVGSTNDVVRDWLAAGVPEVCLAVADEQRAGRGREGRTWTAPAGRALLLSLGFRPTWLAPDRVWRLAATVSLAMADAAEEIAGLPDRAIRLKWPNDLVVEGDRVRKLAGVLGETSGLGTGDPRAIVGIGINAGWPADEFPAELAGTMTSLQDASGGRPIDLALLLDAFLSRLEVRIEGLRGGRFDVADWTERQLTSGRAVRLSLPGGGTTVRTALRVDALTGALITASPDRPELELPVHSGEIEQLRLVDGV